MQEQTAVKVESETGQVRKDQLFDIMRDAVERVLERPDSRRGPYVLDDAVLRKSVASFRK